VRILYASGACIASWWTQPAQVRQVVRKTHKSLVERRIATFRQRNYGYPQEPKLGCFSVVETQLPDEPQRLRRPRLNYAVYAHFNGAIHKELTGVRDQVSPFRRVAGPTGIMQVVVGRPMQRVICRRQKMVEVK